MDKRQRTIELRIGGWRISGGATVYEFAKHITLGLATGFTVGGFAIGLMLAFEVYRRFIIPWLGWQ